MDLISMAMPWWEFVVRALIVYTVLLLLVRLSGKRSVGQFTPFDMILLILLGNAVQNALLGQDTSVLGGLLLAATLITLNYVVGWIAARNQRFKSMVEGSPVKIANDGEVDQRALRSESVSISDFEEAMRRSGIEKRTEIRYAWIEVDGSITILKKPD